MFENRYDIAYKLLIAVFFLMALYSMIDPAAAAARVFNFNETNV
jgi:hypothetical protein